MLPSSVPVVSDLEIECVPIYCSLNPWIELTSRTIETSCWCRNYCWETAELKFFQQHGKCTSTVMLITQLTTVRHTILSDNCNSYLSLVDYYIWRVMEERVHRVLANVGCSQFVAAAVDSSTTWWMMRLLCVEQRPAAPRHAMMTATLFACSSSYHVTTTGFVVSAHFSIQTSLMN